VAYVGNEGNLIIRRTSIEQNLAFDGNVIKIVLSQNSNSLLEDLTSQHNGEGNTLFTKEEFIEAYNNGTGISFISSSFVNSLPSDYLFPTDSSTYRALSGRLRFNMVILQNEN
jgi:hypothetical protein